MKANELMIGDWVFNKFLNKNIKITPYDFFSKYPKVIEGNDLEPILLTTEILEKNGFDVSDGEVMRYNFEEDGQSYHFSLRQMYNQKNNKPNGYSFYAFNVLTIIDYVHQLQHALRLCGIEKEIQL